LAELLWLSRNQLDCVAKLLTGSCHFEEHLHRLELADDRTLQVLSKLIKHSLTRFSLLRSQWFRKYAPRIPWDRRQVRRGSVDTFLQWLVWNLLIF